MELRLQIETSLQGRIGALIHQRPTMPITLSERVPGEETEMRRFI